MSKMSALRARFEGLHRFVVPVLWIPVVLLALTACGSDEGSVDAQTAPAAQATATDTAAEPEAVVEPVAESEADRELDSLIFYQYDVELTGARTEKYEGVSQSLYYQSGDVRVWNLTLAGPDDAGILAVLYLPLTLAAGDHEVQQSGDYRAETVETGAGARYFGFNVSGTITVASTDPLKLTFSYTSETNDGESLTTTGTVEEIKASFQVSVTGDVEVTVPPGTAQLENSRRLVLRASDPMVYGSMSWSSGVTISFDLPEDLTSGEYMLVDALRPEAGQSVSIIRDGNAGITYSSNPTGTLTLTQVDTALSGKFTVSVASADGQTMSATGSFENIPFEFAQAVQ